MSRDEGTLLDIVRAARKAIDFGGGMEKAIFLGDEKTQSAVLHQLLVVGEAARRLSEGFRARAAGIPWKPMTGMRDRLIDGYDEVDLDEVWKTLQVDLPRVLRILQPLVPPEE